MNENERQTFMEMHRELGELKSDVKSLHDKIDDYNRVHGQVHMENKEDIKAVLIEAKDISNKVGIQNGRVTKLESFVIEQTRINSSLENLLASNIKRIEESDKKFVYLSGVWKVITVVSSAFILVSGFLYTVLIKNYKADIKDSIKEVLSEEYNIK